MSFWSVPESIVHLGVMLGVLGLIPLCRRWVGGPLWTYAVAFCGFLLLVGTEVWRLALVLSEGVVYAGTTWLEAEITAVGYLLVVAGFVLWVRHIRRTRAELSRTASTDPLTRLWNRRQALPVFQHEIERSRRYSLSLAVIMIDLDHFKAINDRLGHLAGDAVLRHAAGILKNRVRAADIVGRYGGDEFMVVLPESDARAAMGVAEDLRRELNGAPAVFGDLEIPVTASFGVSEFTPSLDATPENLIARADKALYAVKKTGGNGIERLRAPEPVFVSAVTATA
jgi:diguanylate cyclase (GGDEF)-like protein